MTEHLRAFPTDRASVDARLERRARHLRLLILKTHAAAGQGHLGSSLSIVEILTALSETETRCPDEDESSPEPQTDGDRLVLSKGHAALALYCALAQAGAIPPLELATFGKNGSRFEPHPNERLLPQVQVSTGSLGQGLSIGLGLAHASRLSGRTNERTAVLLGDGELNEGQPWEAAIAAVHLQLGNVVAIVDANGLQQDGTMRAIMPVEDVGAAWRALGWQVHDVDGHDCAGLAALFRTLRADAPHRPKLVVARTVKGRGVPFLENAVKSHYPPPLDAAELELVARRLLREGGHDR